MSNEDYFEEIGIGQGDENLGDKTEKYLAKKDETHRISLAFWPGVEKEDEDFKVENLDVPTPKFLAVKRVYVQGVGYVIVTSGEITKISGQEPRKAVGTIIIKWPTNSKGMLDKDKFKEGKYQVLPWVFSGDKYQKITSQQSASGWPLGKHDLTIMMTSNRDEKYQDFDVSPVGDNLFRILVGNDKPMGKEMVKKLLEKIRDCIPELKKAMGRVLTPDELREKMGSGGGGSGGGSGPVDNAGMASGEDIDGLLDDIGA